MHRWQDEHSKSMVHCQTLCSVSMVPFQNECHPQFSHDAKIVMMRATITKPSPYIYSNWQWSRSLLNEVEAHKRRIVCTSTKWWSFAIRVIVCRKNVQEIQWWRLVWTKFTTSQNYQKRVGVAILYEKRCRLSCLYLSVKINIKPR